MKNDKKKTQRREFLCTTGKALAGLGVMAGGGNLLARDNKEAAEKAASFPTTDYDWTKHRWAYGIDTTKCIGCLRCVEACKAENNVIGDANHFRTWVERYVYLEGEDHALVDSHSDPLNIAASGSESEYRFDNRYKDEKVAKAFFVPKMCNHCAHPACVQACPYGARFFMEEEGVSDKCTWCYHRITKGLMPACVEVCPTGTRVFGDLNDASSPVSEFIKNNPVQVLKPESGNAPMCFYKGLDKDVS